jgi:predicted phosphodiesterase
MAGTRAYSDAQIGLIIALRAEGHEWSTIAGRVSKKFGKDMSSDACRLLYANYKNLFEVNKAGQAVRLLKEVARTKAANSLTAKENRDLTKALLTREDLLTELQSMVNQMPKISIKLPKHKPSKERPSATAELLLSDIHIGKTNAGFNVDVCQRRLQLVQHVFLQEIERKSTHYSVDRLVVGLLGDTIENALMHGRESQMGCEFGNPEQVRKAIELLFHDVLVPIASTGIPTDLVCIAGNHDREEERVTFQDPGKQSLSWVIYTTLKLLCDRSGFTNFTWSIPDGVYEVLDIYGDKVLYEHGDRVKGDNSKKSLLTHLARRSAQLGILLKGMRIGHWHEFSCYDNGAVIVNASVCGPDSYTDVNGYNSVAGQAITYYIKTKNRANSYYYSFLVQLDHIV